MNKEEALKVLSGVTEALQMVVDYIDKSNEEFVSSFTNSENEIKIGDLVRIVNCPTKKYVGKIAKVVGVEVGYGLQGRECKLYKVKYYKTIIPNYATDSDIVKIK